MNGIYKHFKGHVYQVIGIGKDADSLKDKVIYQNVDTDEVWIRDLEDFLGEVDNEKYPHARQQYRFEFVEDSM